MDSGNIEVLNIIRSSGEVIADLELRSEPFTHGTDQKCHSQWFCFSASHVKGLSCRFRIINAGLSSFPDAWDGYWATVSESPDDPGSWTRVPTTYSAEGCLEISVTPSKDEIWVSYFAPFTYDRHKQLIQMCNEADECEVTILGHSVEQRPIELITVGTGPLRCWFIARQHPGESMAEWWAEGFLKRLLSPNIDEETRDMLSMATVYIVPNMNPDGSIRGHLRTNAVGANLNREWAPTGDHLAPTVENSPEVLCVLSELDRIGCDLFVDCHGDEELPHIFFAGTQGIPSWNDRLAELYRGFVEAQQAAFPAFQKVHGYGNDDPGGANLAICGDQIAHRFDCLAVTLEMPYKDTWGHLEPETGWSPLRCQALGASMVDASCHMLPYLRAAYPFDSGLLGSGTPLPEWALPSYENPPSQHCWNTSVTP